MATPGLQGSMYMYAPGPCQLVAPAVHLATVCALAVCISSRDGSTPESFLCSGCQGTPLVLAGAGLQLSRALPCPQYKSSYIEVLKLCCVGKKPSCARGVSVATPLRPAIGWAQSDHNEIGAFKSGTVQRGHASKQASKASLACPVTASDAAEDS